MKVYDLKGSLLKEVELQANVIKMQPHEKAGNKLALHITDDIQKSTIAVLDVNSRELRTLGFWGDMEDTRIICFCTYGENKLCLIALENRYTIMLLRRKCAEGKYTS